MRAQLRRQKNYLSHELAQAAQSRDQEDIKLHVILNRETAINLFFVFLVTLCKVAEK
jgi:hypothetical protein